MRDLDDMIGDELLNAGRRTLISMVRAYYQNTLTIKST